MRGGRRDCCILTMLMDAIIFITSFAFNYSAKHMPVEKTKCNLQNLYNAFTIADIQNIQQKDATFWSIFNNKTKVPFKLMLENYLQVPKNRRKRSVNQSYQLLLRNCSHQTNICIKYVIKRNADDCILDPNNHYIYYKKQKRIYRSTVRYTRRSEFLFEINTDKTQFIHLNNKLNLLFCEQIGSEVTYSVFHYRLRTQSCILRTRLSMPYRRLKRSIFTTKNGGTALVIIIALVVGVPLLIIIVIALIIIVICCYCRETDSAEDELPKSLIENCKRAKPSPEEQGKYLPEQFDATAFQFKGPLIIEYPKLHILEHDLTDAKPAESNIMDRVRFDENLNFAYNIGEDVEIIVKNYGQMKDYTFQIQLIKTTGTKVGSHELVKEDGGDEDEETTNEQENESKQSNTENGKKETTKLPTERNRPKEQFGRKSITKDVSDRKRKSKPPSIRIQKTQPSRYSESSTQTLGIIEKENTKSSKQHSGSDALPTVQQKNFDNTGRNKLLGEGSSPIILSKHPMQGKIQNATRCQSRISTLSKRQSTNIVPTVKRKSIKLHIWRANVTNPSLSGSSKSQSKSHNTRSEENW